MNNKIRFVTTIVVAAASVSIGLAAGLSGAGAGLLGANDQTAQEPALPASRTAATATSQVMFAVVKSDGTLIRSSDGVTSKHVTPAGTYPGAYNVLFPRKVWSCAYNASLGNTGHSGSAASGFATVAGDSANDMGVFVQTKNSSSANTDRSFHLIVACVPA